MNENWRFLGKSIIRKKRKSAPSSGLLLVKFGEKLKIHKPQKWWRKRENWTERKWKEISLETQIHKKPWARKLLGRIVNTVSWCIMLIEMVLPYVYWWKHSCECAPWTSSFNIFSSLTTNLIKCKQILIVVLNCAFTTYSFNIRGERFQWFLKVIVIWDEGNFVCDKERGIRGTVKMLLFKLNFVLF